MKARFFLCRKTLAQNSMESQRYHIDYHYSDIPPLTISSSHRDIITGLGG